jgi:hypothetical protein
MKAAERYASLLSRSQDDPDILAFWLGGSRGKGRATLYSDYDCAVILADAAPANLRRDLAAYRHPGLDLVLMNLGAFEDYAAWGSAEAWDRYSFAHLRASVDKTGRVQALIDAKGCVPPAAVSAFIDASLDHLINQLYRAQKCLRDGDPDASRLEAAEGVKPLLDAVFALHGGRLRPYYKYLAWELETYPLDRLADRGAALVEQLVAVQGPQGASALRRLVADTHDLFRSAGHGAVFDAWGETMDWMLTWPPTD